MNDTAPAATAARAIAGALLRHVLTAAGTALVAHGWLDEQTASSAVAPIAEFVIGTAVACGAAGWAAARARISHWRWVQAWLAPAKPLPSS